MEQKIVEVTYKETKYVSFDGEEFNTELECFTHEMNKIGFSDHEMPPACDILIWCLDSMTWEKGIVAHIDTYNDLLRFVCYCVTTKKGYPINRLYRTVIANKEALIGKLVVAYTIHDCDMDFPNIIPYDTVKLWSDSFVNEVNKNYYSMIESVDKFCSSI